LRTGVVIGDAPYAIDRNAEKSRSAAPATAVRRCSIVGTITAFVTRSRSSVSSTASGAKSRMRIVVAPFHRPR
jgi:hypothetical protein